MARLQPIDARILVSTCTGQKTVEIKFPAGDLPLSQYMTDDLNEEELETGDMSIPFDRRAMEGDMARFFKSFADSGSDPNLKKAQELMYKAWDEQNPAKRLALAHKALKESEDCTDAYVLLAEEEAELHSSIHSNISRRVWKQVNAPWVRITSMKTPDIFGGCWKRVRTCGPWKEKQAVYGN